MVKILLLMTGGVYEMNKKDKYYYIVDIRLKQKNFSLSAYIDKDKDDVEILSLTPYSDYLLSSIKIPHITFHDIVSELKFNHKVLDEYKKIETIFRHYQEYSFLYRDIAFIKTYEVYLTYLFQFLDTKKLDGFNIIYLTDAMQASNEEISDNTKSYIYAYKKFNQIIQINRIVWSFYYKNTILFRISQFFNKSFLFAKIFSQKKIFHFNYDNVHFRTIYKKNNNKDIRLKSHLSIIEVENFINSFTDLLINDRDEIKFLTNKYNDVFKRFKEIILSSSNLSTITIHPFTFLSNYYSYMEILLYTKNNIPKIFMQHGSYTIENIFLKFEEIYPADINFVFNDYTKKLFETRQAKNVYTFRSINFNSKMIEKQKKYDFLYITECTNYSYTGTYVGVATNTISIDANNIFQRHKSIIELFGTKFRDKTICIKIQPGIFMGSMLYVPLLELSSKYSNITIEFNIAIKKLIEKSNYIISDYFSSDFINRELHYLRDIILFYGAPIPLPDEILKDMEKMFILVSTVEDLEIKVQNINMITKDRPRYDDIIEYYSSKKSDTQDSITEIIIKELNAGR